MDIDALLLPYSAPRYKYHWGGMLFTAIGFKKPVVTSTTSYTYDDEPNVCSSCGQVHSCGTDCTAGNGCTSCGTSDKAETESAK